MLQNQGWSIKSATQFVSAWAPSTLDTYNRMLNKLHEFCVKQGHDFPAVKTAVLAEYLCYLTEQTSRPKSVLNSTVAAVTCLADAAGIKNPVTPEINRLMMGLVKSGTTAPMQKTEAMPTEPFISLFRSWPGNFRLTIEQLRLKVVTLLALAVMLRPSDIAPKAKVYDKATKKLIKRVMTTDQVRFHADGSMRITLHGIKNDYHRDGFEVRVNPSSDGHVDPVQAVKCYIERTAKIRPSNRPLFLSLKKPYQGIGADTVGSVLEKAIKLADLHHKGFTAKNFRPTGATRAIEGNIVADTVRKVGRWKSRETFEEHYVHSKPPQDFTDIVYGIKNVC